MAVAGVFSGAYCGTASLVNRLAATTGYGIVTDREVAQKAAGSSGVPETKLQRAFSGRTSLFNQFTYERERYIAFLKSSLAEMLLDDQLVVHGYSAHLLPRSVSHILRVCLIAERKHRARCAAARRKVGREEAMGLVRQDDEDRRVWVQSLLGISDPWEASLYDMVLPLDRMSEDAVVELIAENLRKDVLKTTEQSGSALRDYLLASKVEAVLAREGHVVRVSASEGAITLVINRQVLLLNRLEDELEAVVSRVQGVRSVKVEVPTESNQTPPYRKYDSSAPSRVLLVDDEREFAETLSERLIARDVGAVATYDGQSALDVVAGDEPEVMILDLKMPGIDGIEVLRRIKQTRPDIEVIILTGHGSEESRKLCLELGAFAYLEKPVDIDLLSETLRRANDKVRRRGVAGT